MKRKMEVKNSEELRRHLINALSYMRYDSTKFPLIETVSFLSGFLDSLHLNAMNGEYKYDHFDPERAPDTPTNPGKADV